MNIFLELVNSNIKSILKKLIYLIVIMHSCPNPNCKEEISILYHSNSFNEDQKINFNCTTDTYFKPQLNICSKCDLIFSDLIHNFSNNSLEGKYSEVVDEKYITQIEYKNYYFKKMFSKVVPFIKKNSSVLEIGSYYGVLGNLIQKNEKVKSYTGLELSEHGTKYSKENFNLEIFNETIEVHSKKNKKYDLIILADVVEHFINPFRDFEHINNMLKDDGILAFTTFDMNTIYPKIRKHNYHWIIPFHLFYFTEKSLRKILLEKNLKIIKKINDPRYVSIEYLLEKLILIFPFFKAIWNLLKKIQFLKRMTIKVDLKDLKLFIANKN